MNLGLRIPVPALFALLPMLVSSLRGATVSKANNGDSLNLTTSWTGSVVPCTTDIAQWDSTVTSANTTLLGGNLSISGLKVTSPGGAVTFSAGDTLTVGTSGIDLSSASQDLTIGSGLTLKGKQTWKSFTGRTLSVSGTVSQGTGSVDLSNFKGTLSSLSNHSSGILGAWATTGGALATAVATIDSGTVTALNLVGDNTGYTSAPTVTIQAPASGTTATATATFDAASGSVTGFTITNAGSGYTSIPRVNISATANRINYATNTSGVVSAYTAATAATTADLSNVTSATTNYSFGAAAALTANITANTLRFQGATCILANTNNKNITLNGLMSAGNTGSGSGGVLTVGSAGAATSTTNQIKIGASGVLNITTAVDNTFSSGSAPSSSMIINMPITGIGSSVVVNAGAKDLILLGSGTTKTTNPRSTFSRMFINSGYVRLPAKGDGALGGYSTPNSNTVTADGAQLTIEKGGELRMDNNTIAGNLTLNGGTLSWINAYGDIWNSAINQSYITINADSTFYSGATGKLSVNLPITGTGGLTKTGAGTASLVLTANNTFTGRTVINGGVITYSKSYALYGGDTSKWTASNITVKPIQSPLTATAPTPTLRLAAGGTDEFTGEHLSTLLTNLTASVNNNGLQDGSFVGIDTTNAPSAVVISGNIYDSVGAGGGSVSLKSFGNGTLTLAGNNTYSGKTAVDVSQTNAEAILSVSSLNSVTTNATLGTVHSTSSNLGSPTTVANGTIDLGSTGIQGSTGVLKYTGTGETTDRVVNLNAQALSTGVIEQAGTGLLKFTSPIALYAGADYYKTLKLRGDTAGTGEMAGTIANNSGTGNTATSVNKSGTGTWTLSGNNTYTGTTVVEGGRLVLKGTNVAPSLTVNKDAYLAIEGSGSIGTKVDNTSTYSGNIDASGELYFNSSVDHVLTGLVYCNGTVGTVGNVRKGGTGRLTITDVTSTQATGTASLSGDTVASIALATAGTGFTDGSTAVVRITGGGGSGATATADVDYYTGKVTKINLVTPGSGYTSAPTVTVTAQDAKWPMAWTKSTIVEGGTIVVNGYSLFDTSSLTLDGGKVEISNGATEVVNTLLFGSIPQPIGTYGSMASNATFKDDVHFDGTGMVSVTAYASTFGTWLTTNALTGANADATADSDGDGLNNALEFVLGGIADPYSAEDTNSIGLLPVRSKNANGDIVFTFHRKDVSEGESALIFQWATDKTFSVTYDVTIGATDSVTDDVVVDVTEDDPDAATDTIVVTVPASKALAGKAYGRLVAMGTTYSEDGRDFDRDGLTNFEEIVIHGTNFSVADSDGDGLSDGFETKTYGSNPMLADTDADGVNDGQEIALGRNPLKSEIELILGSLSQQYDGTAKSASAMTTPSGFSVSLTYNGSATAPTAAGSYAVVGTIDDVNYTASANGTLVISKAVATVTLGSLSATYDGTVKLASATTTPSGLGVSFTYDGSPTAPTAAGSYAVVGTIDDANYIGVASGTLVIAKGEATVTLCNLSTTYDGTAKSASATTTPSGLSVNFTYNGSSTAPSAVGSYAVVGTINDANYTGSASGTLVISKGAGTVTLGSLTTTYDGTPKAASAITTPSGLGVNLTYNGSSTAPTAAGSYAVGGTINDVNYTGSANATLVISKGAATVTLGSLVQIDDGTAKSATAITSPAGLKVDFSYNGTSTAPTATGNYTVTGTIRDLNYQGSASGTLALVSSPTISVQPTSVTANQGETVTFNVVAAGNNLSYQWQKNGADIPEAVMASLTIAQVQLADEGSYTVKISNLAGNITSQPANLAALFGPGDLDGDGLTNNEESMIYHTNPNLADTDHDGLTDGYEVGIGRFSVVLGSCTWEQARLSAIARGGNLASFTSQAEWEVALKSLGDEALLDVNGLWIGANDAAVEGRWAWTTGESFSFSLWATGQPDNLNNSDYAAVSGDLGGETGKWYDFRGVTLRDGYILEIGYKTDPTVADADGDGLSDAQERAASSNPFVADTDGDGLSDGQEANLTHTSPTNADSNSNGINDAQDDADADGLSNLVEVGTKHTDPLLADTDGDGLSDGAEALTHHTNPLVADTDGDSYSDGYEVLNASNPTSSDSFPTYSLTLVDGGVVTGGRFSKVGTLAHGSTATLTAVADAGYVFSAWTGNLTGSSSPQSLFMDGNKSVGAIFDHDTGDGDSDGLTNYEEAVTYGTRRDLADSDGDGLSDFEELRTYQSNPLVADTDGDGLSDGAEVTTSQTNLLVADTDADGYSDGYEVVNSSNPNSVGSFPIYTLTLVDGGSLAGGHFSATGSLAHGTLAQLTAVASAGYVFSGWTNDLDGVDTQKSLLMNGNKTVGATFVGDTKDDDGDGLTNFEESVTYGTDLGVLDTDGDGLSDGAEVDKEHTNPLLADTDGDGLNDGAEALTQHTDPLVADTDGDSYSDGYEVLNSSNPTSAESFPTYSLTLVDGGVVTGGRFSKVGTLAHGSTATLTAVADAGYVFSAWTGNLTGSSSPQSLLMDGNKSVGAIFDHDTEDADSDGLTNYEEAVTYGTRRDLADSDGDGLSDFTEIQTHHTNPILADSNGDGLADGVGVQMGLDPLLDHSAWVKIIHDSRATFGLYTQQDLTDLRPGSTMVRVSPSAGGLQLRLNVQKSTDLLEWQDAGEAVYKQAVDPTEPKQFFRFGVK